MAIAIGLGMLVFYYTQKVLHTASLEVLNEKKSVFHILRALKGICKLGFDEVLKSY